MRRSHLTVGDNTMKSLIIGSREKEELVVKWRPYTTPEDVYRFNVVWGVAESNLTLWCEELKYERVIEINDVVRYLCELKNMERFKHKEKLVVDLDKKWVSYNNTIKVTEMDLAVLVKIIFKVMLYRWEALEQKQNAS